jgi:hypothetical protein
MTIIYSHKKLRDREPSDFYPTPIELCNSALGLLNKLGLCQSYTDLLECIDVGAGDGVWGAALKKVSTMTYITGIDIRDDAKGEEINFICDFNKIEAPVYDEWVVGDFMEHNKKYDLIFGNIPFRFANEFIQHSLELLNPKGIILYLLQSAISESKKRFDLFYNNGYKPLYEYQSVRRISFTGNGKSDNTAYSIFIWEQGQNFERETIKRWLDWDYNSHNILM